MAIFSWTWREVAFTLPRKEASNDNVDSGNYRLRVRVRLRRLPDPQPQAALNNLTINRICPSWKFQPGLFVALSVHLIE